MILSGGFHNVDGIMAANGWSLVKLCVSPPTLRTEAALDFLIGYRMKRSCINLQLLCINEADLVKLDMKSVLLHGQLPFSLTNQKVVFPCFHHINFKRPLRRNILLSFNVLSQCALCFFSVFICDLQNNGDVSVKESKAKMKI